MGTVRGTKKVARRDYVFYIRWCFWLFLFFLLTEGIFRRWLLPGLNYVFLVIRDPIVVFAVCLGIKHNILRGRPAILIAGLGLFCFLTTMILGHGNLVVALYGARVAIFYFPFMYICARVLDFDDICKVGRVLVLMIIPECIITMLQFNAPQSDFINIGPGGDPAGAGFHAGAQGHYRPPGIFTFISALADYYAISFEFLLFFLLDKRTASRYGLKGWFLYTALLFYIISIPISISRTHLVQTAFVSAFFAFLIFQTRRRVAWLLESGLLLLPVILFAMQFEQVQVYTDVFFERFDGANKASGGFASAATSRTFGWFNMALDADPPFFGFGDGQFSNFGLTFLYGVRHASESNIAAAEGAAEMEWGRLICEEGIACGTLMILLRLGFALILLRDSYKSFMRGNNALAFLTVPMAIYSVSLYQMQFSYNCGFMDVMVICCLVAQRYSLRNVRVLKQQEPQKALAA